MENLLKLLAQPFLEFVIHSGQQLNAWTSPFPLVQKGNISTINDMII